METHIKLTEEEKLKLEGQIIGDEIAFGLTKMNNNQSSGTDGFSSEFF